MTQYKFDSVTKTLWRKNNGNEPELLGFINTLKGRLTREQKLKIIRASDWIEL